VSKDLDLMNSVEISNKSSDLATVNILVIMFTDRISGPARQLFQLIKLIDRSRFTASIASTLSAGKSEFVCEIENLGIPFEKLPQSSIVDPAPIKTVSSLIHNKHFDIIQSHGYKSAFIAFFARYFVKVPWVAFLHGHTTENLKVKLYHALEFKLVKHADRIITVSQEMRDRLVSRGLPAEKTVVIRNSLSPEQFASSVTGEDLRERFGVSPDEKLIGVIGRFSSEKGVDIFLKAFKMLIQSELPVKAILVGEGSMENELRDFCLTQQINDRVIFAGYQQNIAEFYPILDLMVLPSRSEGLPNVALEALHFGVPVVATDVGGTSEVIIDGETGLLVPSEAVELMRVAIYKLFTDIEMRSHVIEQGKQHLLTNFSPQSRVQKIESIYSELAQKRTG